MVLDKLSASLKGTLQKIARSMFVDEKLINELVKDIQRALLQSDVNVKLVLELTKNIKERITKEETPGALTKKEHLVNIVYARHNNFSLEFSSPPQHFGELQGTGERPLEIAVKGVGIAFSDAYRCRIILYSHQQFTNQ